MSKQFTPFWQRDQRLRGYDNIQEPSPHHTVLCTTCGYLYNRTKNRSNRCPQCRRRYGRTKTSEFYVNTKTKKITMRKNAEQYRW